MKNEEKQRKITLFSQKNSFCNNSVIIDQSIENTRFEKGGKLTKNLQNARKL